MIVEITVDEALELLRDGGTVEIVATGPGVKITLTAALAVPAVESDQRHEPNPPPIVQIQREKLRCAQCLRTFASPNGLAIHVGRSHKPATVTPRAPTPVSEQPAGPTLAAVTPPLERRKFDPDQTRAAAAASI